MRTGNPCCQDFHNAWFKPAFIIGKVGQVIQNRGQFLLQPSMQHWFGIVNPAPSAHIAAARAE